MRLSDPAFDSSDNLIAQRFEIEGHTYLTFDVDSGEVIGTAPGSENHPAAIYLPIGSVGCSIAWDIRDTNAYLRLAQSDQTGDGSVWKWEAPRQLGEGETLSYLDDGCIPGVGEQLSPESENPIGDVAADPSGSSVLFSVAPALYSEGSHRFFEVETSGGASSSPREIVMEPGTRLPAGPVIDWI